jgi:hypothetical protein
MLMADIEEYAEKMELKSMTITMILSAMGFLVALTWRDAIQKAINAYIPVGDSLTYTFGAALLVTVLATIATYILIKLRKADIVPDKYEDALRAPIRKVKNKTFAKLSK